MRVRVSLCLVLLAVLGSACGMFRGVVTLGGPEDQPEATSIPTDPSAPEPSGESQEPGSDPGTDDPPPPAPPPPEPYEPLAAETHPNAKTLGASVVQTLTTYEAGETIEDVTGRLASGATRERIAEEAAGLFHAGAWSRGEVVYPQFGGLTADRASIMVVLTQTIGEPGAESPRTEVRTIDVRLRLQDDAWVLEGVASTGGQPVERPEDLAPKAAAVLDDPRIELPDSARWDIHRGATHTDLLTLLARLAETTGDVGVVALENGHPYHIFGTDRMSDHLRGRAVDIYRVGGEPVIRGRSSRESVTHDAVAALYADPLEPVVGSPWALDEYGGRSFTDPVHLDHLHAAVRPPPAEGAPPPEEDAGVEDRDRRAVPHLGFGQIDCLAALHRRAQLSSRSPPGAAAQSSGSCFARLGATRGGSSGIFG